MNGAQLIVKCLEQEKVSVVFGYPGATIAPFFDALNFKSDIRCVITRHEANAGHSAGGYARAGRKVGVCAVTSGPGATNLITAIATAYMDSVPIVAITGQVDSKMLGRDVFQEADITGATEPFTKYSYLVKSVKDIPKIIKEAFYIASTGRPGPVLIDIPVDIQLEEFEEDFFYPSKTDIIGYKPRTQGHSLQIDRALEAISKSQKPVICAGGGVISAKAEKELSEFSEKSGIPVVSTLMGIGAMPCDSHMYLGMLGTHGVKAAKNAVKNADLLILCGARVGDRTLAESSQINEGTKVIHIDIDPAEIGKNIRADIPIVGDIKLVLISLISKYEGVSFKKWAQECAADKTLLSVNDDGGLVDPCLFIRILSQKCREKSIMAADVGQNQIWSANNFNIKNGRFLTSGGMGTMGYSIPAAVGAKIAENTACVVAVCGDGSFQMQIPELATIVSENIDIKIVVIKNTCLGMIRELEDKLYGKRHCAIELGNIPDIKKLAATYNIASRTVKNNGEISEAVEEMLNFKGAFLLECLVAHDIPSIQEG